MPPKKKPKFGYTHEQLLLALDAVKKGESLNSTSKKFGIPFSTLSYKVSGKTPIERRMGPEPLLGFQGEEMLVNWVKGLAARGFPISSMDLLTSVQQIAKDLHLETKFPNGKVGQKWVTLFLQRHPDIAKRKPEKLGKERAIVTEKAIRNWFLEVKTYLVKQGKEDILTDPSRIFNLDETAFFLSPKSGNVLGIRGQKNVYEIHSGSDKENLTVLCNINSDGKVAPTLVVFPGQRYPKADKLKVPEEWSMAKTESGWMNGEVLYEYFSNTFINWLKDKDIKRPVIMFLDGHRSHLTYHLSLFCSENGIVLITLPPNCTHIMQPLDVSVFGPVKKNWSATVRSWRVRMGLDDRLTKFNFSPLLKEVLDQKMKHETIKNGFKRCGLCPFDDNAVDYTKVDVLNATPDTLTRSNQSPSPLPPRPTDTPHISQPECVQFFESFINPNLLSQFNMTYNAFTPIWTGDESAHDLFVAWKKAKDFFGGSGNTSYRPYREPTVESPADLCAPSSSKALNNPGTAICESLPESNNDKLAKVLSPGTGGNHVPSPFKKHLFWPGTPTKTKKKTKLPSVKLPAVLTSKEWQDHEEKRRDEKKQEELKKEERKRAREEKKKSKQKPSKYKKKLVFDVEEDWVCKECGKRYSAELILSKSRRWIECDTCKNTFHYKCVPKKHLDAFGLDEKDEEEEDELQFICHHCANDIDSDADPFVLSETSDEESE